MSHVDAILIKTYYIKKSFQCFYSFYLICSFLNEEKNHSYNEDENFRILTKIITILFINITSI